MPRRFVPRCAESDETGPTRSFADLTEAIEENGRSRVYLGIHWDFDDLVGQETGTNIGMYVSNNFTAVPQPSSFLGLVVACLGLALGRVRHT